MSRTGTLLPLAVTLSALLVPVEARAQAGSSEEGYLETVARYFQVPHAEVLILAEWNLPVSEIPVVLFVSRRGGISPDALVSLRRDGASWSELGRRYGVSAGDYHVPLGGAVPPGPFERVYGAFGSTPRSGWSGVRLSDDEVVGLVNLRMLSESRGVPALRVLDEAGSRPDWIRTWAALSR